MVLRERFGIQTPDNKDVDKMSGKTNITGNGNKISDVSAPTFVTPEKKIIDNKVSDINKSPSISSNDSCTRLTIDKRDDDNDGCCAQNGTGSIIFKLSVCFLCGIVFGIMFVKGRVFEPKSIRDQMVFRSFIMLKMFLSAVCVGQLIFSILSMIPATRPVFEEAVTEFKGCFQTKGVLSSAVGAFILGIGLTLSGACPGMVLSQIGTWVPNSIFTLLGCFLGALSYGMLAPHIQRYTQPKKCLKKQTVDETLNWPYAAVALPMSIFMGVVVILMEYFWDYEKDIINLGRSPPPYDNIAVAIAWRPSVAGAMIGLVQLPLVFVIRDTMGGSSSYVTIVSQWVVTKRLQELFPYLADKRCGLRNWWQVFYVCGAILGAALAAIASDTMATSQGPTVVTAFFGGVLMLWGARFASGCTSGHGLSGMGLLTWLSFIAVPCMFAGGIVMGFTMDATGALDDYVSNTLDM